MKQRLVGFSIATVVCACGFGAAQAQSDPLTAWFMRATSYNTVASATKMSKPEVLPGKPAGMNCLWEDHRPQLAGVWELKRYDRTHRIALAVATTDQCSVALFRAPAPPVSVPDADLSGYTTRLGLHIGSSYASVRSTYGGGPEKSASHFAVAYASNASGETISLPPKKVALPQTVTIVVDDGRVSAISIYTDLAPET